MYCLHSTHPYPLIMHIMPFHDKRFGPMTSIAHIRHSCYVMLWAVVATKNSPHNETVISNSSQNRSVHSRTQLHTAQEDKVIIGKRPVVLVDHSRPYECVHPYNQIDIVRSKITLFGHNFGCTFSWFELSLKTIQYAKSIIGCICDALKHCKD